MYICTCVNMFIHVLAHGASVHSLASANNRTVFGGNN